MIVGRQKKNKPKRPRGPQLRRSLAQFDADSLWTLLIAAGASPALRARWPSVGALAHEVLLATPRGSRPADASHLAHLLATVHAANPGLPIFEDFIAADPRLEVRTRIKDRALRLFPGCIERPVADIDRAHLVARVVDDELVDAVGFGISHLLDVLVGYIDFAVARLATAWPEDEDDDLGESVSEAELLAAAELVSAGTPANLTPTESHVRALDWITADTASLPYSPDHPQSCFGRFARVRDPSGTSRWLPLAFLPEVLSYAVGRLARRIADRPLAQMRFAQESADSIRRYLWRFTDALIGSPETSDGPAVSHDNVAQWAVPVGARNGLLIQLVANLAADMISLDEEPAAMVAAHSSHDNSETRVPFPCGSMRFQENVDLTPLLVTSTADHTMSMQIPGMVAISLDDLRWMCVSSVSSHDLFNFCRDMTRPGLSQIFGFEAIDYWEWWRANSKSVFSGGRAPSVITFSPHGGEAEWVRTRKLASIEVALAQLRLPGTRDLDGVENLDASVVTAYRWLPTDPSWSRVAGEHHRPPLESWSIWVGSAPFAVAVDEQSWSSPDERRLVFDMAGSLSFGVDAVGEAWTAACWSAGVRGVRLYLVAQSGGSPGRAIQLSKEPRIDSGILMGGLSVDADRFLELADGSPEAIRTEFALVIGDLLTATGVRAEQVSLVTSAWVEAPPTMTLDLVDAVATRNFLPSPVELDDAYHSETERVLAEKVRTSGVEPGTYVGDDAKVLDHLIAGLAKNLLEEQLAEFAKEAVSAFAMVQLDRTVERRNRELRDLRNIAKTMNTSWDPVERAAEVQSTAIRLRRCNEMIVEAALMTGPTGTRAVDEDAWSRVLAVANAYYEATMRSEAIHYQVSARSLTISEAFELSLTRTHSSEVDNGRSYFHLDEQNLALAAASEEVSQPTADTETEDASREVSTAFSNVFGFSPMDLYATLFAAARMEPESARESAVFTTKEELIDHVLSVTVLGDEPTGRDRVEAAVDLVTTTAEELKSEPWRPWLARTRKRRLLAQPLLLLGSGQLVIAPHYTLASLAMYRRYIDQGQLPWSQPPAEPQLERAMERFRDAKNRQLERAVAGVLREAGYIVIENVKESKCQRLNIPSLSGEIDVVALRPNSSTVWLLEAKDPVSVHSTPQLRGQLDDFYTDRAKKPAYATQLARKLEDLAPYANEVAAALGVSSGSAMTVSAAFVTRHPIPAAFASGSFPFYTLAELADLDS